MIKSRQKTLKNYKWTQTSRRGAVGISLSDGAAIALHAWSNRIGAQAEISIREHSLIMFLHDKEKVLEIHSKFKKSIQKEIYSFTLLSLTLT